MKKPVLVTAPLERKDLNCSALGRHSTPCGCRRYKLSWVRRHNSLRRSVRELDPGNFDEGLHGSRDEAGALSFQHATDLKVFLLDVIDDLAGSAGLLVVVGLGVEAAVHVDTLLVLAPRRIPINLKNGTPSPPL